MANFIYNSARSLFSKGLLDWTGYKSPIFPDHATSTPYAVGDKVVATAEKSVFQCTAVTGDASSGASSPTWTTDYSDITDGNVTWKYFGPYYGSYTIEAAMVNTVTASASYGVYSLVSPSTDIIQFTPGESGTRNMASDLGWNRGGTGTNYLIRDGGDLVITAELSGRHTLNTGACGASNITFSNVNTGLFAAIEGIVIYVKNTTVGSLGAGLDWAPLVFIDTLSGGSAMSITPNGGDIVVQWNASGIFRL